MEYRVIPTNKKITLHKRGYYTKGDTSEDIGIISSFLVFNFLGYEKKLNVKIEDVLGDYYGNNLTAWVKEFQKQNGIETTGNVGKVTLAKMREYGLEA